MTETNQEKVRVAVVQAAPVIMDKEATLEKVITLTEKAAADGAEIVVFPEAYIPAYPRGLGFKTKVGSRSPEGKEDWLRYWKNSVQVPGQSYRHEGRKRQQGGAEKPVEGDGIERADGGTENSADGEDGEEKGKLRGVFHIPYAPVAGRVVDGASKTPEPDEQESHSVGRRRGEQ